MRHATAFQMLTRLLLLLVAGLLPFALQWLLTGLKFHPIEGLMYLAPACCVWLMFGAAILEYPKVIFCCGLEHPLGTANCT